MRSGLAPICSARGISKSECSSDLTSDDRSAFAEASSIFRSIGRNSAWRAGRDMFSRRAEFWRRTSRWMALGAWLMVDRTARLTRISPASERISSRANNWLIWKSMAGTACCRMRWKDEAPSRRIRESGSSLLGREAILTASPARMKIWVERRAAFCPASSESKTRMTLSA